MADKPSNQRPFTIVPCRYGIRQLNTRHFKTLKSAVKSARHEDFYGGKYTYQVLDESGAVVADIRDPYEGARIDVMQHDWLEDIQTDYGIDDATFRKAIDYWLEQQKESNDA